jgi:flagellar motor switch protein FliN/FliY
MADEGARKAEPTAQEAPAATAAPADAGRVEALAAEARQSAAAAAQALGARVSGAGNGAGAGALDLPSFGATAPAARPETIELLDDVELQVRVELGRTRMYVEDVLRLGPDSVVELDKAAGDPVDIFVNDRHVARGEVLVLDDNFCVRISEIVQGQGPEEQT